MLKHYKDNFESYYNDWQQIDIVVSRDCTLRCSYCYLHKHIDNSYDRKNILKSFDSILDFYHNRNPEGNDKPEGIVVGFYPEPWVDIEKSNNLILDALEIILKYERFYENFMILLGTNGVRLDQDIPVLNHVRSHLSVNVTVDGVKEMHDLYRVFPDGTGSWDTVVKNVKEYQEKYNIYSTKVTIGPDTIKYIYDSVLYLWNELNMKDVNINVVFEDLWGDEKSKEKSLIEFDEQLEKLYNYIVEIKAWENEKYVGILGHRHMPEFNKFEGEQPEKEIVKRSRPYCGATAMRSIDVDGGVYPCFRLSPYSLNKPSPFRLEGDNFTGSTTRSLYTFNGYDSCHSKCLECPLLSSCAMCVGGSLEEKSSIYYRTTHHCEFQKMQYKWARKLFIKMNEEYFASSKGDIPVELI